jgi:major intracellular serine protease
MQSMSPETYFNEYLEKKCKLVPSCCEREIDIKDIKELIDKSSDNVVTIQAYIPKGVSAIGAPGMWSRGIDGSGILVGVVDTGIGSHPDLQGKVVVRRVYTGETTSPRNNHGTHVAGTIAANGTIRGVAYKAQLGDYRVLDNNGSGNYDWIVAAIYDAVYDGCDVISMSLGGPVDYPPLRAAIQYAFNANVPVIVASGNEGDGSVYTNEYSYPAMYSTTQSVGAADYNGSNTRPASFTNTNYEVDCCSQGVSVVSTIPGGNYVYMSGTSMATPHISGAAALLIHQYRKSGRSYTTSNIYSDLVALAKDVYIPGIDNATGRGFVTFNSTL